MFETNSCSTWVYPHDDMWVRIMQLQLIDTSDCILLAAIDENKGIILINISIPIPIFGVARDYISKKLFLEAYCVSNDYYWDRCALGSHFKNIAGVIEYDIDLPTIYTNSKVPIPRIALKSSKNDLSQLIITVLATGGIAQFQDRILVYNISKTPIIVALPSIPLHNIHIIHNNIIESYKTIKIEIIEAKDANGKTINLNFKNIVSVFNPLHLELYNDYIKYKWGTYWHIEEMRFQQNEIRQGLYYKFMTKDGWPLREKIWSPRFLIYSILSLRFIILMIFWSQNIRHATDMKKQIHKNKLA